MSRVLGAACLTSVLVACGADAKEAAPNANDATSAADVEEAFDPYDFTTETIDGTYFGGDSLAGKPAVLWFWAPWCPICDEQKPMMADLGKEYGDRVAIYGVAGQGLGDDLVAYATKDDMATLEHLWDSELNVWRHFGMQMPARFVVIDAEGKIVYEGWEDSEIPAIVEALATAS
ncbi:MAG TPA: redoxin domain-containing protein [Nocardioidaceae bacterium]|nr:redoxin domain-containing protein [Nocardioidaceae bacterium]